MKKRLTVRFAVIFFSLAALIFLVSQVLLFLFGENYSVSPGHLSAYSSSGYYEIDPETILTTIDQGNNDVFVPFFGDLDRDEPYYDNIAWTQSDYLKITNALSLKTWNEPLDLDTWEIEFISLIQSCENDPRGFHTFEIVYSRELGVKNWEKRYETRLIEIFAWQGLIRWGKDAIFSAPLLFGWDGIELPRFRITADDALQIAEENSGSEIRSKVNNDCRIILTVNQFAPLPHPVNWLVDYDRADFYMHINPYTGKHKILR